MLIACWTHPSNSMREVEKDLRHLLQGELPDHRGWLITREKRVEESLEGMLSQDQVELVSFGIHPMNLAPSFHLMHLPLLPWSSFGQVFGWQVAPSPASSIIEESAMLKG
jgi:hypothetical protein